MDYETVSIDRPEHPHTCWLDSDPDLGWDRGELKEIRLTLCGDFILGGNVLVSVGDFLQGSSTKYLHVELQNYKGEVVEAQDIPAEEMEYFEGTAAGYFIIDEELTNKVKAGSYTLLAWLRNTLPANEEVGLEERTILNLMVTETEGLDVVVT